MKCINCDSSALWVYHTESVGPAAYCDQCLPRFLRQAARSGSLPKADSYQTLQAEVADALAPEPAEAAADEPRRRRTRRIDESNPESGEAVEETAES